MLEPEGAPAQRTDHRAQLVARHRGGVLMKEIERGGEAGDRRPELVRDIEQEILLQPEQFGIRGDVTHGPDLRRRRRPGDRRRHDLEHPHPLLTREPRALDLMTLGLRDRRRAAQQEERAKGPADELVLSEQPEGGGIRTADDVLGVGDEDAVGECDERVFERDRRDRVGATAPGRSPFAHAGIQSRTRVPWPGLESISRRPPARRADSRIWSSPRLPRVA